MADFGISIVEKLIEVIGSELIKHIFYRWGYKSELEKLEKTIIIIKDVLVDAEAKRNLSMAQQAYISDLKAAVYDADDLFDEFFTLAKLNEIDGNRGGKFFEKVRAFFSSKKDKVSRAKQMSRRVKEIRKQLDTIADDHNKFGLINYTPIVRRREETCSYVEVKDIIGRDFDKKEILDVLLDPSASDEFCFLTIVGVGGLGKTALAQLVFQDESIKKGFLSLWVCVSDQDGGQFGVMTILCKILELLTNETLDNRSSFELVQRKFQEQISGKKYFLVLDDIWNEDYANWKELEKFLRMGLVGSRIVVTTRSEKTATCIGSKHVHKLKGLSEEDSWSLFEMTAFGEGEKDEELVKIGVNIVKKCCNNPLAIKVIGSLLHGQVRNKWESIEESDLGEIKEGSDQILHTLKLSYYNLTSSLKSCFSYCAIYSKGEKIYREILIDLWLAQGYIVPLVGGQSLEVAAQEYFLILLRRCFFQDVEKNEYGDIVFVKMHDFIHDIAQEVSKDEICVVNSKTKNVGEKVRHLIEHCKYEKRIMCCAKIRSYVPFNGMVDKEVENMTALRTLLFMVSGVERSILSSLHKFLLLRYVGLHDEELLALPDSFTRLYNLQTLILLCERLEELPKDFGNLINLRHLDISRCRHLIGMPLGIDKCTNLRTLPYFVAGNGNSYAKLKVLQVLNKIKGSIRILIRKNYEHVDEVSDTEGGYLKDTKHLTNKLYIEFEGECINPEGLMKNLQPPSPLKSIELHSYNGKTIQWSAISPLHHLIHIEIKNCDKLGQIPVLSKLLHLKSLTLHDLYSVEYMEEGMSNSNDDTKEVVDFFPSLECLEIWGMQELKGWWKEGGMRLRFPRLLSLCMISCHNFTSFVHLSPENFPEHQFPTLCKLYIIGCPKLASNFVCASLEELQLKNINERLLITYENYQVDVITKSRDVLISHKVSHLKSLRLNGITTLTLDHCIDSEVESFVEFKEELNQSCASSLQTLKILRCYNLRRLSGLESLTALQKLSLNCNYNLSINEDDEEPWKSFHSLRELEFSDLSEMKSLPKGMQHLTSLQYLKLFYCGLQGLPQWMSCLSSLQSLYIRYCPGIESFPEAMKDLTSLNSLSIEDCPDLIKICKTSDGKEFQKIKHIPKISLFRQVEETLQLCEPLLPAISRN
ncbi:putative disease resistance protein RGA1 [Amaranthus tricolor]|uniref:putative disease resistance protein RGA1 n=1 Tax=Amaranthus tricolor TaxID=29722 RepID=UPI00258583D6|nr:putative disease resistance protein RGA1 [Amaranthus tricolor]